VDAKKSTRSSPVIGAIARVVVPAAARIPWRLGQTIGGALGRVMAAFPGREREISALNVAMCLPELSPNEQAALVRRSLTEAGRAGIEVAALWCRTPSNLAKLDASVIGNELLEQGFAAGEGVVLIVPHFGNWEFFNHFLTQRYPFMALYRSARIAELDRLMRAARERTGCTMVPATTGGVRQMLRGLRDGHVLMILPDQEPVRSAGGFGRFFGIPALTMTLVRGLLQKTDAVALFGMAERGSRGRFIVRFREVPDGLADPDPILAIERLNHGVEACVRHRPEQYLWSYKRFRTRPEGELSPYQKQSFLPENIDRLDPVIRARVSGHSR
jgi:KDO2-lipid IV(A) lauroyltransferase